MSLGSGTRLGPYEIVGTLGAGGMGEVYRARDTKLNRNVAIKVLLPAVASDPDRLARFSREAQVLASLNHPNIAHILGLEESGGVQALVMELVEGPTLADHIAGSSGPMPVREVLSIAKQIAEALEAAHEQGIIHRDLKPANIKVRPDGRVKVLDFGLAKALAPAGAGDTTDARATMSPTLSMRATQAGIILGTAAYMSPEQAAGKPVDKRSDLWAFGVVLLEMLTGRQVFGGETTSHVLASVLKDEPDWTALPADTPAPLRRLLRRWIGSGGSRTRPMRGWRSTRPRRPRRTHRCRWMRPARAGDWVGSWPLRRRRRCSHWGFRPSGISAKPLRSSVPRCARRSTHLRLQTRCRSLFPPMGSSSCSWRPATVLPASGCGPWRRRARNRSRAPRAQTIRSGRPIADRWVSLRTAS